MNQVKKDMIKVLEQALSPLRSQLIMQLIKDCFLNWEGNAEMLAWQS